MVRFFLLILFVGPATLQAQQTDTHELTLYAFPTMQPFNWESPSTLFKTAKHCFFKTLSLKDNYLLGHMCIGIKSPLLPRDTLIAMTSANKKQRVDLILKDKIGLAIMGATLEGMLESEDHLIHMIQVYGERKKLAFITFRVSESAMRRMLDFITEFSRKTPNEVQPSKYYGGVYWPLNEDEGAGCSAFALGVLASANLLPAEASRWLKDVNIPMSLIGGEYNQNKRISFARIKKVHSWYQGNGSPNVDYVNVQTYDPSDLFDWIGKTRLLNDSIYKAVEMNGVPGLIVNCTSWVLPADKPYFVKRMVSNLFMDVYRQKITLKLK